MYVNIIKSYRDVVAISDAELLGKVFEEGKAQLNVKESFYRGEESNYSLSENEVIEIIKERKIEDATFNIVGKKAVETALETGLIDEDSIGIVDSVPFALVLL